MEMKAEQRIAASREEIWAALNDTEVLKASMPGCDSFEAVGENKFEAQVTTKIGPVKAKFRFKVNLSDIDPPNGYTTNGEVQGGVAGFAKCSATVTLREDGADTILTYTVKANVGGKIAQLGARLIDGVAKKMADEFFSNFTKIVAGNRESGSDADHSADATSTAATSSPREKSGATAWVWLAVLVVLTVLGLIQFIG